MLIFFFTLSNSDCAYCVGGGRLGGGTYLRRENPRIHHLLLGPRRAFVRLLGWWMRGVRRLWLWLWCWNLRLRRTWWEGEIRRCSCGVLLLKIGDLCIIIFLKLLLGNLVCGACFLRITHVILFRPLPVPRCKCPFSLVALHRCLFF